MNQETTPENGRSIVTLDKIVMPDFIKELRKSASSVFLAFEEDIAHDISGKLNKAARELDKMAEREKKCPTLAELPCHNDYWSNKMTFDEWHEERNKPYESHDCPHYEWEKMAWNAAIDAASLAVEAADHNDDDSGHAANCNAMMAVEKLKAL